MLPLYRDPHSTFRFAEDRRVGRFHFDGVEPGTHISNPKAKATPGQVRAEVWMSLVRGSRGLIYFVHQFQPRFVEAGLLDDKEMTAAVGAINKQIHELAPVLNSPTVPDGVTVASSVAAVPVEAMVKRRGGATY